MKKKILNPDIKIIIY